MSELLPSELARLILGYFESKGYTKTVETMLSELPELAEVAQRKKKGQKMNLKVGDVSLTDMLDDYCLSKEIVYENITNYPSTFSSTKKIQALAEQVRSVIEIALRSKTFKFYPKNLYRSKHYMQSSLSQPNEADVLEYETINNCCEARLDVETTPESSLPGSSKRDACTRESPGYSSQPISFDGRDQLAPETTPQKRKGSLRKKGQPSPKVQPQTTKQIDADERMEKLFKNLLENKELHTKIADSINNTLLISNGLAGNRRDPGAVQNENLPANVTCSSSSQEQWFGSTNQCQEEISAVIRTNSLPDSIISKLSLQVTNDPMMDPILASIDCDLQGNLTLPHRQLTTPVPHLLTFSNSVLDVQSSSRQISQPENQSSHFDIRQPIFSDRGAHHAHNTSASSDMMLEECFSPSQSARNQNLTLVECFRNQDNQEDNMQAQSMIFHEGQKRQTTVPDAPYALTLGECFTNSDGHVQDKSLNSTLTECLGSEAECQEEAQNLSLKKCLESQDQNRNDKAQADSPSAECSTQHVSGRSDGELRQEKLKDITKDALPGLQSDGHCRSETVINTGLPCKNNLELRNEAFVKRNTFSNDTEIFRDKTEGLMCSSQDSDIQLQFCRESFSDSSTHFSCCDEPLDLTRMRSDSNKDISMDNQNSNESHVNDVVSHIASSADDCENRNQGNEPLQNLCPETSQHDYSMSSSFSPFRPPSVRAVSVPISNDSFVNAKYFSGTPDHPNNYTITELLPLPPVTPQPCMDDLNVVPIENSEKADIVPPSNAFIVPSSPVIFSSNAFIVPSSPVTFSSHNKIISVETTVAEEHTGIKLIGIRINNDEPTVLVKIPSCEEDSAIILESLELPKELEEEAPKISEELSKRRRKWKRIGQKRNLKLGEKSSRLCDKGVDSDKGAVKVPKRGKKRNLSNAFSLDGDSAAGKRTVQKRRKLFRSSFKWKSSNQSISKDEANNEPGTNILAESNATHLNVSNSMQEVNSSELLKNIPNMSDMEDLVDKLESSNIALKNNEIQVDTSKNNQSDGSEFLNKVESHSIKSLSPRLMSLLSFSKNFVLNNNFAQTAKSPSSSERITVYRGSLSTPRNKSSHIRVLDFNTPMKGLSLRKKSPAAKANLQFSPSSSSQRPQRKLRSFDKRIRTQSLTISPSVKAPLQAILETSREGMDTSNVADQSIDLKDKNDENQDNDVSNRAVEVDLFLSEDETSVVDSSDKFLLPNKQLSSLKKRKCISFLQTPGKISPVCLEPTTPFLVTRSSVIHSETTGTELNTPVPVVVIDDMTSPTPSLKLSHESYSVDSEEKYYQPSERSLADSSLTSVDDIETVLIRTAQQSEKEMLKLTGQHEHKTCIESVDVEDKELQVKEKQIDSHFGDTIKGTIKCKLAKLSNKDLGELVEKEMEKLEQMKSVRESQRQKREANAEQVVQGKTTKETSKQCDQLFITDSKTTTRISEAVNERKPRDGDDSQSRRSLPLYETIESVCYEHFDCNFELLKASTVEILENSHIDSSKALLSSLLDLFEKEKFSASNLEQEKKVHFMIKIINFYSSPEMLQNLTKSRESDFICTERDNRSSSFPIRPSYEKDDIGLKSEWNYMSCKSKRTKRNKTGINCAEPGVLSDEEEDEPRETCNVLTSIPSQKSNSPPRIFYGEGEHQNSTSSGGGNNGSAEKQQEMTSGSISQNSPKTSNFAGGQKLITFPYWSKEVSQSKSESGAHGATEIATSAMSNDLDLLSDASQETGNVNSNRNKSLSPTDKLVSNCDSKGQKMSPFRDSQNEKERREESFVSTDNNDEYSLIERQLAALDGSVTDSPSIRAELTSNVMDDENISVMFTPSSYAPEERFPFRFDADGKRNPNSLMTISLLPGTPEKRVQEICQSVVKNKVAMVAIPALTMKPQMGQRKKRPNENRSTKSRKKTFKHDEISYESENAEQCEEFVNGLASSAGKEAEQSMRESCALSFSEYIELFSLNLSSARLRSEGRKKDVKLLQPKNKSNKGGQNKDKHNFQKSSKKKEKKTNEPLIEKKTNEPLISILKDSLTKNSRKSPSNNLKFEVASELRTNLPPSSSRKLEFAKRKRSEEEERRGASKPQKFKPEESRKNVSRKSSKQNKASEDVSLISPRKKSLPNINCFERRSKRKNSTNTELTSMVAKNATFDDTASLVELHLSSSDSDQDEHCSTLPLESSLNPKKITKSLLEGGTFELSKTPRKMQTVISKYPNQDSFFHFNEESMLSIPPTPGKHLFLPVNSLTNEPGISDAGSYSYQPDYASLGCGSTYAESETNPPCINPLPDKKKYDPISTDIKVRSKEEAMAQQHVLTCKKDAISQRPDKCTSKNPASNPQVPVVANDSIICREDRIYKSRSNSPEKRCDSKEIKLKKRSEVDAAASSSNASPSNQSKRSCKISKLSSDLELRSSVRIQELFSTCENLLEQPSNSAAEEREEKAAKASKGKDVKGSPLKRKNALPESSPRSAKGKKVEKKVALTDRETKNLKSLLQIIQTSK